MMLPELTDIEARLIGSLMEKSVTTPDQMPLTLNALTNAANQKSSRDPVMALTQVEVQQTARKLAERNLIRIDENFKSGVEKYRQRLCGTGQFADIRLDGSQFAIMTLLLLRGAQTPGELRSRAGRLHAFEDNAAVVAAAQALVDTDSPESSLLVQLPRQKGRKDGEFMHQLCGAVDVQAYAARAETQSSRPGARERIQELEQQVAALKEENERLAVEVATLRERS